MGKQKLIGVSNNIVTVKNEIQTDIFNGGSSEFFINMNPKDIPPKDHEDRGDFVRREKLKCKQGININGVPITGRLYYHLNFHKIALDTKVGKDIERVIGNPLLRDNEWMIFNAYEECLNGDVEHDFKKQAFMIGGGRQISKSDSMCSMSLYAINLFDNPEAVLLFTNSADKQTYTKKAQLALTHGESFIMRPTIDNNWTKTEIRFGLTNKDNTTNVIGRLYMYNTAGDNAPQIASGKSISFFAYDECAKDSYRRSYEAVLPALVTPYGWRCAPILAFTGGDVQKSQDAEDMFMNPEGANVKAFSNEGKKTGFFMGGWYRQDFKYPMVFTEYLNRNGYIVPKGSELDDMKILVTDFDKANQTLDEEIVAAGKSKDPTALLEKKMFFPRTIKEMFLKNLTSNFKSEYINQQREYIKSGAVDVTAVELYRDLRNGEVKHKLSSKPFVNDWKNPGYSADAAIKIFDFPKYTSYGVHVLGLDPYREDEVGSSNSLGYITVLRRNHSDLTDDFRGKQVASYLGRTKTVKDFHQMVLDLAEYYNAQILYEHSDRDLLSFFENKHKTHLLMDTVPLQREINVLTKTKNAKGLRPTVTNKKFLINTTLGWVNDELEDDTLGYAKIFDDILLQQLEAYDPDENLDAYIGFSHAVAAYNYFEKFGTPVVTLDTKIEEKKKVHIPLKNAFGITFKRKPTNAFGL